jgi:hypothetical protein
MQSHARSWLRICERLWECCAGAATTVSEHAFRVASMRCGVRVEVDDAVAFEAHERRPALLDRLRRRRHHRAVRQGERPRHRARGVQADRQPLALTERLAQLEVIVGEGGRQCLDGAAHRERALERLLELGRRALGVGRVQRLPGVPVARIRDGQALLDERDPFRNGRVPAVASGRRRRLAPIRRWRRRRPQSIHRCPRRPRE